MIIREELPPGPVRGRLVVVNGEEFVEQRAEGDRVLLSWTTDVAPAQMVEEFRRTGVRIDDSSEVHVNFIHPTEDGESASGALSEVLAYISQLTLNVALLTIPISEETVLEWRGPYARVSGTSQAHFEATLTRRSGSKERFDDVLYATATHSVRTYRSDIENEFETAV